MASLIEQIQDFLRDKRGEQRFHESLRALAESRPQPPIRTSLTFDSHIEEARGNGGGGKSKMPQNISLAWDDANFYGSQDVAARNWQSLTPRERKDILLNIYLNNPWVSACVDVIAKRITSGGLSIEPTVDKPNEKNLEILQDFCLRVNDDWDLLQYVRASITDELIFGDTYTEIVWKSGLPFQLYKIDCLTMGYKTNRYGQITDFLQQMDTSREPQMLDAKSIIRWWFPHPRSAVEPFAPIERVQDAVNLDKKMVNWLTTFFQKGAKFPYTIEFPGEQDEADRYLTWFRQNYTGEKNAHLPPITWGGAKIIPSGKGSMDVDFEHGMDRMRAIVLSAYHVPPAIVGIIESGNIGGGTGEDQEKSFMYNTCDPIRHMFFEKFNYRIVQKGFGITDYKVSTRYADYRSSNIISEILDKRIKNGSMTMNEARAEMGKSPYPKGGDIPVIITPKEVTPVPRLDSYESEQAQTAQQQLEQGDLNTKLLKAKVDQANNPQPPPGMPGQQPLQGGNNPANSGNNPPKSGNNAGKSGNNQQQAKESLVEMLRQWREEDQQPQLSGEELRRYLDDFKRTEDVRMQQFIDDLRREQQQAKEDEQGQQPHTGMMIAFFLDAENATKLAIPGGEPAEQLHITLVFMGDSSEYSPRDIEQIKSILANFAYNHNSLKGTTSGIGRFAASDSSDGMSPIIALVNVPGIQELRADLVKALEAQDFTVDKSFAYTPHVTLSYIPADAPAPVEAVPELEFRLREICLAVGDKHYYYQLDTSEETSVAKPVQEQSAEYKGVRLSVRQAESLPSILMEFNPNHDAHGQFASGDGSGANVSVEYRGFTKVSPALQQTVNDAIAKSRKHVIHPDNLKVVVHNKAANVDARGYYTHKDKVVGNTIIAHGPAINVFVKGQTNAEIEWTIAHEFGHADHYTRYPESADWPSPRREDYAQAMAKKVTGRV